LNYIFGRILMDIAVYIVKKNNRRRIRIDEYIVFQRLIRWQKVKRGMHTRHVLHLWKILKFYNVSYVFRRFTVIRYENIILETFLIYL